MTGELLGILHSVTPKINLLLRTSLFFIPMTTVNSLKGHKSYQQKSKKEELKGISSKGLGNSLTSIPKTPVFSESGLGICFLGLCTFSMGLQLEPVVTKKCQDCSYLCTNLTKLICV